ncbi:hypothetical protein Tco_0734304, partial [Tanacetum coccineum]
NAQDEGRTRDIVDEDKEIEENVLSTEDSLSTDKEKVSTDRPIVSTDGSKVSTDRHIKGTDEQVGGTEEHIEGTEEHIEGNEDQLEEGSATQATQIPTSTIFGDDETIAKVLLNMSQAKAVSREKEKGVELKDIEEADRPRPTSTRSLLTLKHLPKIDPKDKGKKKIEEEDESESESDGIPLLARKSLRRLQVMKKWQGKYKKDSGKARIEADRLLAEKLQEDRKENEVHGKDDSLQYTSENDIEKENDELRLHLTIAPDEEKEVDYEILDRKYPIKEWKTEYIKMRYLKVLIEYFGRLMIMLQNPREDKVLELTAGIGDIVSWKLTWLSQKMITHTLTITTTNRSNYYYGVDGANMKLLCVLGAPGDLVLQESDINLNRGERVRRLRSVCFGASTTPNIFSGIFMQLHFNLRDPSTLHAILQELHNLQKLFSGNFKKCKVLKLQALTWKDNGTRGNNGNVYASGTTHG